MKRGSKIPALERSSLLNHSNTVWKKKTKNFLFLPHCLICIGVKDHLQESQD